MDTNKDGYIDAQELRAALARSSSTGANQKDAPNVAEVGFEGWGLTLRACVGEKRRRKRKCGWVLKLSFFRVGVR